MSKNADEVYRTLRAGILSGAFPPNAHLTAQEVGERLKVSRTPAREGLLRLAAEGLVRIMPNQGAFVASWTPAELIDIYDVRARLEPMAAAAAATRIDEAALARLERLTAEMEDAARATPPDVVTLSSGNDAYHRIVAEASGNARLAQSIGAVMAMPMGSKVLQESSPARLQRLMNHYRELIVAFRARDPDWARAVMECHVLSAKSLYARLAAGDPHAGM
jgi:DNA-binding GntR family transcriptional regulator